MSDESTCSRQNKVAPTGEAYSDNPDFRRQNNDADALRILLTPCWPPGKHKTGNTKRPRFCNSTFNNLPSPASNQYSQNNELALANRNRARAYQQNQVLFFDISVNGIRSIDNKFYAPGISRPTAGRLRQKPIIFRQAFHCQNPIWRPDRRSTRLYEDRQLRRLAERRLWFQAIAKQLI